MLSFKYNIFYETSYKKNFHLFIASFIYASILIFLRLLFCDSAMTIRQVKSPRPLSLFLSLSSLFVLLSRGSNSRFRARSLTLSCTASRTYLAESREARRRSGLAAAAAAAARSPSEVKVRRVGTGCARIHFFGLALDFFPSSRTARRAAHQFPMYAPPT